MALKHLFTTVSQPVSPTFTRVKIGKQDDWELRDSDGLYIYVQRNGVERALYRKDEGKVWQLVRKTMKPASPDRMHWSTKKVPNWLLQAQAGHVHQNDIVVQYIDEVDKAIMQEAVKMQQAKINMQVHAANPAPPEVAEEDDLDDLEDFG